MHSTQILPIYYSFLLLLSMLLSAPVAKAAYVPIDTAAVYAEINDALIKAQTPADSIPPLYNLFDLKLGKAGSTRVMWTLFNVADRANNPTVRLDLIRNLANTYKHNDSIMEVLETAALKMPESDDRSTTLAFLHITRVSAKERFAKEEDREAMLDQVIKEIAKPDSGDIYDQIVRLSIMVRLLGGETKGDLLKEYFDKLEELIKRLPSTATPLINQFYTFAAISFTASGDHERAVNADRALLKITDDLSAKYAREGRPYRTFDRVHYVCYRRLLNNFEALTVEEVDHYYAALKEIVGHNPILAKDLKEYQRAEMCYLLKHERYTEVIPMLQEQWRHAADYDYYQSRFLLQELRKAARAVGNEAILYETTMAYDEMLQNYIDHKSLERYKELEILYELNDLRDSNKELELERQRERTATWRQASYIGLAGFVVLLVLVGVLLYMNRRMRRLTNRLKKLSEQLRQECIELETAKKKLIEAHSHEVQAERQKDEFFNNMSHEVLNPLKAIVEYSQMIVDCIDDKEHHYLAKFGHIVTLNADLLQSLFKDVLNLAAADNSALSVSKRPTSVNDLCNFVVDSTKIRLNPGVTMTYAQKGEPDVTVNTDSTRAEIVLINLLQNAAKFTENGQITLSRSVDRENQEIRFAVSDTGIGIPEGKEEEIFGRYEKLNKYSQGIGLGLSIARLVARILGGDVVVDSNYHDGARFVFTIPLK